MARQYSFGRGVPMQAQGQYQQASNNHCGHQSPMEEKPPVYRDIPLYLEDIPRGKTVTLVVEPSGGKEFGNLFPQSFVFSGTRDLWLMPTSSCDHMLVIDEALPLDTFRPGAPHQISWPMLRPAHMGGRLQLDIENRGRARNEQNGTFVGRISCLVKDEAAPSPF